MNAKFENVVGDGGGVRRWSAVVSVVGAGRDGDDGQQSWGDDDDDGGRWW